MTTYKGETLTPYLAIDEELEVLNELLDLKAKMKELSERYSEVIQKLPRQTPLVHKVDGEYRTVIIDAPTGHYVSYRELELTMDAKTTKADLKTLGV